ncbi:hypothetical protein Cme02nite_66980 [Catellatospora methionotrophica]|uniref:Uncharacterized protein n=1 Tax=Catellatospora methionotrophica TaxID=121620 RepID=A0A8J3LN49_9ACTN|nr:hypothetical protein [Catellatospora methionotrophica]GIG18366.1 hypothetical protein Cme02nite_66980 [Catellatospora methionotrophica]
MNTPPARARTRIGNDGDGLLELVLEWSGQDHWLRPGDQAVVVTPMAAVFDVYAAVGRIVVHFGEAEAWVEDIDTGPEQPGGWTVPRQRRPTQSMAQNGSE